MRKFIAVLIAVLMLGVLPAAAMAASNEAGDWKYIVEDREIKITGYIGVSTDVVIPSAIGDIPVTSIGQEAFRGSSIRSCVVPNCVKDIASFAWADCRNLEEISLPYFVHDIGNYAFENCTSLRRVVLPKGLSWVRDWFQGCTALEEVVIPYGVDSIAGYAFAHCNALQPITVPETVTQLGSETFAGCTSMHTLTYGGSREQWNDMASYKTDLPLTTRIWATAGVEFDVQLSGPEGPLVPGQTVEIQVSCEDADIPDWAQLAVELDLEGITAPTYQVVLTANQKTATFIGTVTPGWLAVSMQAVAAGGRGMAGDAWAAPVATVKTSTSMYYEMDGIGVEADQMIIQETLTQYDMPTGVSVEMLNADGSVRPGELPVATGNLIRFQYPDGSEQTLQTIVKGDILGTGVLRMDQLVRLASALKGAEELGEPNAAAADLNGNGQIDLSDLVLLAVRFRNTIVNV